MQNFQEKNGMTPQELRRLRLSLDLTQAQMAEKLYIGRVWYGMIERGKGNISRQTEALALKLTEGGDK